MAVCQNSFCGKTFDEASEQSYVGYDHQKKYEKVVFCSPECLKKWIIRKLVGMIIVVTIGLIGAICVLDTSDLYSSSFLALLLLFAPYMLRQCFRTLKGLFNSGTLGEIISLFVLLIGTVTVVYPLYKIIKETIYYVRTIKELKKNSSVE
ncbi:MAG: hypothetical protein E7315_06680 [Clostridiales bacterium]|nr:hypothetical protein [Clostridiales bacterium]